MPTIKSSDSDTILSNEELNKLQEEMRKIIVTRREASPYIGSSIRNLRDRLESLSGKAAERAEPSSDKKLRRRVAS